MEKLFLYGQKLAIISLAMLFVTNCSSSNNSDTSLELQPINSVTVEGYTISLESDKILETGYNTLFWKVKQDGKSVDVESISINPMMDMMTMHHSTPVEQPVINPIDNNYFYNMAVFIMPSGEMGSWTISFEIITKTDDIIVGTIPVEIASSWRLTSVRNENDKVYFITWMTPEDPVMGNNELRYLIHTRETMMSFPAVSDVELVIYPYMDMGGGQGHSTDFSTPIAKGEGLYEGSINYSMSGVWTTSVQIIAGNDTLPEAIFEYSVKAK